MPVIASFEASGVLGGVSNAKLTSAVDGFTADLWPPDAKDFGVQSLTALTSHHPVNQTPRTINAFSAKSFFDDFYNRIHISPSTLAMGNILSTQTDQVQVWNAHLTAKTLNSISGLVDGVSVSGQPAPPLLFQPLAELTYDVSVSQDGPLALNSTVQWDFTSEAPGVTVTAMRVTIWRFVPDWADGITEQLEWRTEIYASETLVEQRRAMRTVPRRSFNAKMFVEGRERQALDLLLFAWSARIWLIPVWHEIQLLTTAVNAGSVRINCATAHLDFYPGGLVVLRGEDAFTFEAVEIESIDAGGLDLVRPVQNSWPIGSRLYPGRTAQLLSEPQRTRLTDTADSLEVDFLVMENCEWPEVLPATLYRGFPVLEKRPDESEDLQYTQARLISILDNGHALPRFSDVAGVALPSRGWRWKEAGRQVMAELRSLLYGLRGSQVAVWIPTHADDLTVVDTIAGTGNSIDVAWCGVARFAAAKAGRRDIRIELWNGTTFHRRITGAAELSPAVERISIDSTLGVNVLPTEIMRVCWMTLSRGASDRIEIVHETDSEGIAQVAMTFRGVRDDDI